MKARIIKTKNDQSLSDQIIDKEIRRQLVEKMKNHEDNLDAIILYVLYCKYGWGKKRLRRFYDNFLEVYRDLIDHYETGDDAQWSVIKTLKSKGVDIEAWNDETYGKDRGNTVDID